jgi:6-pyruvoyltetrahydropterin/6-carboxytetrahydropterin synthase
MAAVTVRVEWDMGHRLPHHNGACRNLHGHHYIAEATVLGEINTVPEASSEGMVIDFTDVKTQLRAQVLKLDHMFLLHRYDELAGKLHGMPGVVLVDFVPTAENIAQALLNALPQIDTLKVWETPTSYAKVWR